MAKGFDRLHVKPAIKSRNKFNLDCTHLTTMSFGQAVPLWSAELVGGDEFNVKGNFFSRMAPLVKPTYGKFSFRTMNVFVPFHQVCYDADAFFDGKTTWEGVTPHLRYITYETLVAFLNSGTITTGGSATNFDYSYVNASGTITYRSFTDYGKYVIKVLNSLGYVIPQNIDLQVSSDWYTNFASQLLSALPILCFAKAYNDYMSQSQRYNTSALTNFLRCVKYNIGVTGYTQSSRTIITAGLLAIFDSIKVCYENDYFTSAWQWPNSALNQNETINPSMVPSAITYSSTPPTEDMVNNSIYGTSLYRDYTQQTGVLLQRSLDWLKSFDDFVRRNNYSGSRVVQQIYSRFGIKPDDYKSHYADVISTDILPVQVGDVTATTTATGQPLGDYAGKGIMNGSKGFTYHATDRGLLMVIGWYTVSPMMSYGFDRSVLKVKPLDYYNPEFDGQAIQPISYGEVFTNPKNPDLSDTSLDNQVYGFTEIYNEYRFGRDKITGDFRKYDNNDGMNTWHTGRLLTAVRSAGSMVAQSSSMINLPQYRSEFQRMFSITNVDPFYLTCQFEVSAVRPMLSLNQVPKLGEGDINVPRNGNEIN